MSPFTLFQKDTILLDHGSGGLASQQLIKNIFLSHLDNPILASLEDSAVIEHNGGNLAFTTDSYVVDPIFFPGGDIGCLSIHGTINDLAMRGARPICLSLGLILEEGFAIEDLEKIIISIARASKETGVPVIAGDTKVVPKGKGDKIFINTSGIGTVPPDLDIASRRAQPGDIVLVSGTIADHGATILIKRNSFSLEGDFVSDTMPLHGMVTELTATCGNDIHTLRDPTRGGVATTLCEIAETAGVKITVDEEALPIKPCISVACELLGIDPLYLANEGKCLVLVAEPAAEKALQLMRSRPEGKNAAIIGKVTAGSKGRVELRTAAGGTRLVTPLTGEPLPRIC